MPLTLDIVTPKGVALQYSNLDRIVMRQSGMRSKSTRELVMLPCQGHMSAPLPAHTLRVRSGSDVIHIQVDGGLAERCDDTVTLLTRGARVVAVDQQVCMAAS